MKESCSFCNILNGSLEGSVIETNTLTSAMVSLEGHVLVIPTDHITVEQLALPLYKHISEEMGSKAFYYLNKVKEVFVAEGANLHLSDGRVAGQSEFHAHVHVVPRFRDDKRGFFPRNNTIFSLEDRLNIGRKFIDRT